MSRRRRRDTPLALFWSRAEQRRFTDAVELLVCSVREFQQLLNEEYAARSERARKANRTRKERQLPGPAPDTDAVPHPLPEGGPDDEF